MVRHFRIFWALTAALALAVPAAPGAWAQNGAYRIGPRDVLTLTIRAGGEVQTDVNLTVPTGGMINVPFIGSLKATGKTSPELEQEIQPPLARDYFVNPEVHVHVKEYHSLQYNIAGAVKAPGLYEMTSRSTLMELIAKAGGVLSERGNVAYIQRGECPADEGGTAPKQLKVDLLRLLDQGDMRCNVALESGDVVYIPLQKALNLGESKVYVQGEVRKPGIYDFRPGMTALSACIMAGGFDKYAAPNRAWVIRSQGEAQKVIKINLVDVNRGKIQDLPLQPGDRINVPESYL